MNATNNSNNKKRNHLNAPPTLIPPKAIRILKFGASGSAKAKTSRIASSSSAESNLHEYNIQQAKIYAKIMDNPLHFHM